MDGNVKLEGPEFMLTRVEDISSREKKGHKYQHEARIPVSPFSARAFQTSGCNDQQDRVLVISPLPMEDGGFIICKPLMSNYLQNI